MPKKKIPTSQPDNSDLVLTPGGWRPKSQVHLLETGQHVSGKGRRLRVIETSTGKVVQDLGETSKKKILRTGRVGKSLGTTPNFPDTAWIENSSWTNDSGEPIVYFSSKWVVPQEPASNNNQTIYLFNGLQQTPTGPYILQPVLQWGSSPIGGGNYWSIANWYMNGQNGPAITLKQGPIKVNPGDVLQGIMTLTNQSGDEFSYTSSFAGYPALDIPVTEIDQLTWACETLECYYLTQCSDYPNTTRTTFYDIEIKVGQSVLTGKDATINWQANTTFSDCGQICLIVSNDSPGGMVDLYYKKPIFLVDNPPRLR
jgi:hypothetical protein